jgi:hypothetical protein
MTQGRGQTNVKITTKNPMNGHEEMHHVNITSETYFPASGKTEKIKSS